MSKVLYVIAMGIMMCIVFYNQLRINILPTWNSCRNIYYFIGPLTSSPSFIIVVLYLRLLKRYQTMLSFLLLTIKHILRFQGIVSCIYPFKTFLLFHPWHSMFSCGTVYLLFEKCLLIFLWRQVSLAINSFPSIWKCFYFVFWRIFLLNMKFWFARSFLQQFREDVPFVSDLTASH